jgi:hypothetical protein
MWIFKTDVHVPSSIAPYENNNTFAEHDRMIKLLDKKRIGCFILIYISTVVYKLILITNVAKHIKQTQQRSMIFKRCDE